MTFQPTYKALRGNAAGHGNTAGWNVWEKEPTETLEGRSPGTHAVLLGLSEKYFPINSLANSP
jgi:hypothetical protein